MTKKIAFALAAIFFLLGASYSLAIPIFEASDETLHYPYVKHLADGKGLPVAGRDLLLKQEATQGPLFYAVAALTTFWIDSDNLKDLLDYNPHWRDTSYRAVLNDNQNLVAHGPADKFPFQGAARAIHLARVVSVLFGALAVACTVLIADELFPRQPWLALGSGVIIAFNPQFIRTSATVSNDSTSTALVALLVWLALRWSKPRPLLWQSVALGLLAGLAILAKLNGAIGLVLAGLILGETKREGEGERGRRGEDDTHSCPERSRRDALRTTHQRSAVSGRRSFLWRNLLFPFLIIVGVAALVSGWFFLRNWLLYGELTASNIHLNLAGRGYLSWTEIADLWPEIERTFWASFGWGQIRGPDWVYTALRMARYVATIGLFMFFAHSVKRQNRANLIKLGFLLIWLSMAGVLLVQWVSLVGSVSHARLLFPALPAIAILGMLGLGQYAPEQGSARWIAPLVVGVLLLALSIGSLVFIVLPAYAPPPAIQSDDIPADLPRLDLTYADTMRLLAADATPAVLHPGDSFTVDLYWQAAASMDRNYSVFVRLLDPAGNVLAGRDTYPGLGLLPTKHWPVGKLVKDSYPLKMRGSRGAGEQGRGSENLPLSPASSLPLPPFVAEIRAGLFDFYTEDRVGLPVVNSGGEEVTPVVVRVKIVPSIWEDVHPQNLLDVKFEDNIQLTGYDWDCEQDCQLTLYWQPTRTPSTSYTVFVQHWQEDAQKAGFDGLPREGSYPTNWWAKDEIIVDRHTLPALSGGELRIGLYQLETGIRASILSADVAHQDNSVIIPISK